MLTLYKSTNVGSRDGKITRWTACCIPKNKQDSFKGG